MARLKALPGGVLIASRDARDHDVGGREALVISWLRSCWSERVSYEGGLSLIWMDGLLVIPLIMAAFFYPMEALLTAGALVFVTFVIYEGCVLWKRHHVPHPPL